MAVADGARAVAARLVEGVIDRHEALSDQMQDGALQRLAPAERARAQRLALLTLRRLGPVDRALKPFLRREPPPFVHAVLRVAMAELLTEGAAAHGVVNTAVEIVRSSGQRGESFVGLVNAVLRRASESEPSKVAAADPQPLPGWLRGRLMSAWGKPATLAMERAQMAGAPVDLTPRSGDAGALVARVGGTALPTGSVRLRAGVQISDLPGYAEGEWWVQDAATALAARALAPRKGERILDLCAAPGGKTMQLAAAGAEVTALDLSPDRMRRLEENLKRTGLSARVVVADALTWEGDGAFDAILIDAPCSATGTIRRHPDLPFVRDASGLRDLFAMQAALLDRALALLRPGGRMVFATCSLLPDEGERQASAALERHPGLTADPEAVRLPGIEPAWLTDGGGLRLRPDYWPEAGGMDGFFIAAFRRPG